MRKIVLLALLFYAPFGLAGAAQGKIEQLWMTTDSNVVSFSFNGEILETPRCNKQQRFAFDSSKPGGQSLLESLLRAKEHDYTIKVKGRNLCQIHWQSEDVHELSLE